ncbi:MAG: hypothetical protein KC656_07760 [Myxococcales bacterium]|nr:hypothetical protein [Myxococcales bacterium]MCB9669237.1 hypothetical protein [Alphaproteobacteria bacterium]
MGPDEMGPEKTPEVKAPEPAKEAPAPAKEAPAAGNAAKAAEVAAGIAAVTPDAGNAAAAAGIAPALAPEITSPAGNAPAPAGVGPSPTAPESKGFLEKSPLDQAIGATGAIEKLASSMSGTGTQTNESVLKGFAPKDVPAGGPDKTTTQKVAGGVATTAKVAKGLLEAPGNAVTAFTGQKDGKDVSGREQAKAAGDLTGTVGDVADVAGKGAEKLLGEGKVSKALSTTSKVAGGVAKGVGMADNVSQLVTGKKADGSEATATEQARAGVSLVKDSGDVASSAAKGVETVAKHLDTKTVTKATTEALVAKGLDPKKAAAAAEKAAKAAVGGGSKSAIKAAAQRAGAGKLANVAKHTAEAAASAGKSAKLAKVAAKAGGKAIGKAAARFAPGVNVAMAAIDTVAAGKDIADAWNGKGSVGKAAVSGVRALGSIAAATNIPVVSQVGAGISAIADFALSFW